MQVRGGLDLCFILVFPLGFLIWPLYFGLHASLSLTQITMVVNLMDGYLAKVAPDINLKLPKFSC